MFKFYNYNIILPKYLEIVKKKGSSFVLPALGVARQGRLNINSKFPSPKFRAKPCVSRTERAIKSPQKI